MPFVSAEEDFLYAFLLHYDISILVEYLVKHFVKFDSITVFLVSDYKVPILDIAGEMQSQRDGNLNATSSTQQVPGFTPVGVQSYGPYRQRRRVRLLAPNPLSTAKQISDYSMLRWHRKQIPR